MCVQHGMYVHFLGWVCAMQIFEFASVEFGQINPPDRNKQTVVIPLMNICLT